MRRLPAACYNPKLYDNPNSFLFGAMTLHFLLCLEWSFIPPPIVMPSPTIALTIPISRTVTACFICRSYSAFEAGDELRADAAPADQSMNNPPMVAQIPTLSKEEPTIVVAEICGLSRKRLNLYSCAVTLCTMIVHNIKKQMDFFIMVYFTERWQIMCRICNMEM